MKYYSFNTYLREQYGEKVQRISLNAGLSCPGLDGADGERCVFCNESGFSLFAGTELSLEEQIRISIERYRNRGIGKFIATGFAEAGANLMIASRKIENCEKTASELESHGIKAIATKMDVAVEEDVNNMIDMTMKEFGKIDILVNNAGITWGAPTLDFPLEKWDRIFDVNIKGL